MRRSVTEKMYHDLAWKLTILSTLAVALVFLIIVLQSGSRKEYAPIQKKAYKLRNYFFFMLVVVLISIIVTTLTDLPFDRPVGYTEEPLVIEVEAVQFGWNMSSREVKIGQPVEFQVTSADVNHGFGIYDEKMILHAQTQAMPEYTNVLYHTFTEPGTYHILCMEYCGISHHYMMDKIVVVNDTK
jgi:cytochrome c oxidase subunit 2